jgi:xylulokinase
MAAVRGIGLSGHMHGAVLLGKDNEVLRPCILWNDGRSAEEAAEISAPSERITGNIAMPGFTAPKLIWVKRHEPEIFAKVKTVLLPKDYAAASPATRRATCRIPPARCGSPRRSGRGRTRC